MENIIRINLFSMYSRLWQSLQSCASDYKIYTPSAFPPNLVLVNEAIASEDQSQFLKAELNTYFNYRDGSDMIFPAHVEIAFYVDGWKDYIRTQFENRIDHLTTKLLIAHDLYHELIHYCTHCEFLHRLKQSDFLDKGIFKEYIEYATGLNRTNTSIEDVYKSKKVLEDEEYTERTAMQLIQSLADSIRKASEDEENYKKLSAVVDLLHWNYYRTFSKSLKFLPPIKADLTETLNALEDSDNVYAYEFII